MPTLQSNVEKLCLCVTLSAALYVERSLLHCTRFLHSWVDFDVTSNFSKDSTLLFYGFLNNLEVSANQRYGWPGRFLPPKYDKLVPR